MWSLESQGKEIFLSSLIQMSQRQWNLARFRWTLVNIYSKRKWLLRVEIKCFMDQEALLFLLRAIDKWVAIKDKGVTNECNGLGHSSIPIPSKGVWGRIVTGELARDAMNEATSFQKGIMWGHFHQIWIEVPSLLQFLQHLDETEEKILII